MAQSLVKFYIHVVFSTKYREKILDKDIREELYSYLGGICNNLECFPIKIGGYLDHVHVLCTFSKKITLIKFVEEIKKNSSKWIKTKGEKFRNFHWQDGYGAFSVNPYEIEIVKNYIENQVEHHRKNSFQEEYREFLVKYNVDYKEEYVWD